ncbi:chemotaxis-specific protein-glutamate methyltransferase CheB [Granulicella rosea]|uniref:chemotaxis-specific protein-glutamate methyltransferase CheB n=1 Tax=Granulicella rosea TaxID=474952 RepID=UPI001FE34F5A|nr:chemotaxis-specific protein-glutamate methyltransferase CheB [Granulicella rosea]
MNDSRTAAEVLRRILAELPEFELIWTAYSGEEALRLAADKRPEIILMDLIMPGIDGAETTRRIMQTTPCVILVVTATTVGNRSLVFEAMGYGALDAVNTPVMGTAGDMAGAEPLLQKLRMVARLVGPGRHTDRPSSPAGAQAGLISRITPPSNLAIVAIGSSTGGPQALAQLLGALPGNFPAAVLVAQHVDEQFAPGLAAWLQHHAPMPVSIGVDGERLVAGHVYLAGSNDHMILERSGEGGVLRYTPHPRETAYRPSVDALFSSLAHSHRAPRVGVLLTGMGRDGGEGLLAMRQAGAYTIAQDKATSIVYGMPKAAADLKAAMEILPLGQIGARVRDAILAGKVRTADPLRG